MDPEQFELIWCILHNTGAAVLANNERIVFPAALRFLWETESVAALSPGLLASVGVLCMGAGDVGWRLQLAAWIERRPETDRDIISVLCDR